jgi:hypothetical protein
MACWIIQFVGYKTHNFFTASKIRLHMISLPLSVILLQVGATYKLVILFPEKMCCIGLYLAATQQELIYKFERIAKKFYPRPRSIISKLIKRFSSCSFPTIDNFLFDSSACKRWKRVNGNEGNLRKSSHHQIYYTHNTRDRLEKNKSTLFHYIVWRSL